MTGVDPKVFARPKLTDAERYPLEFYIQQDDLFGWWVYSRGWLGTAARREVGQFWRRKTAMRVADALTRLFRNGCNHGRENPRRGGARIA